MLATAPEARCIGQPRLTAGLDRFRRIDLAGYRLVFGRLPRPTAERSSKEKRNPTRPVAEKNALAGIRHTSKLRSMLCERNG